MRSELRLELQSVTKHYNDGTKEVAVLEDVNLQAEKGEVVWVTGASGAGKSSLLNICGLLTKPTFGAVILDGEDAVRLTDADATKTRAESIGMIFQSHNVFPELTALENVLMAAAGKSSSSSVIKTLKDVGLEEQMHVRAKRLSGGQQQRIAVVRAMVNKPTLILADEPISGLDEANSEYVLEALSDAAQQGCVVLISSHDTAIESIATTRVHMSRGSLSPVEEGTAPL